MASLSFPNLRAMDTSDSAVRLDVFVKTIWTLRSPMPGWAGIMQMIQKGSHPGKTAVMFLLMIDMSPSDTTCVYSTPAFICRLARENGTTPIVTFDQPLYWKAYSIIANESQESDLKTIVLRLDGFHLEMSFLGAIGYIMSGSGLHQILETVYAPNVVTHMLSGKAVARAVRGHMLIDNTIQALLVTRAFKTDAHQYDKTAEHHPSEEENILRTAVGIYDSFITGDISMETVFSSNVLEDMSDVLAKEVKSFDGKRTASLWIRYMEMVQLLKSYIRAERMGDWYLHLKCVHEMLPYFAASGHNLYAKSSHTYLAAMQNLHSTPPDIDRQLRNGYHVLRRSDRNWAGLSSDLVIEQELMRSVKTTGGLTRGRGMGEVQRAQWLLSMPACADVNNAMQALSGVGYQTSDQHKDTSSARQERDCQDIKTTLAFLTERNPFSDDPSLRNIETGETADEPVNQDVASEIGTKIVESMAGQNILEHSCKRSQQVVTLSFFFNALQLLQIELLTIQWNCSNTNCVEFPLLCSILRVYRDRHRNQL